MERIYTKAPASNRLNQAALINFPTKSNLLVLDKPPTPPAHPVDRAIKNTFLNKLAKKTLESLSTSLKLVHLDHSENIYSPDEPINFIYFPETAVFSEFRVLADGRMIELIMTGREGFTGVTSLFNAHPPTNFTQVLQAGEAWRINSARFIEELNNAAEVKNLTFDYLDQVINCISQKAICNGFHLIENRLCTWLLLLQERTGNHKLNITHEQIALALGAHRPSVTQITQKMREEEIITYTRGNISILDRPKLKAAACSCYLTIC